MPNYRRANQAGGSYFFTVVSYRRQPIFCEPAFREALRVAIESTRTRYPFEIDAWVLLPEHLHCIWTLPPDDADFATRWGQIKRRVCLSCGEQFRRYEWLTSSKRKHREATIWQRRYWEHLIRDQQDFARHMDYIHYNPVKHGLCPQAADWPYSTFHRLVKTGVYPANWGGPLREPERDFGE